MCWGRDRLTPVAVSGLAEGVKAITDACALMTGGGVKCWDDNLVWRPAFPGWIGA